MDKGYDSDAIRAYVHELGGVAVIPPKANRSTKPAFDEHLYAERHRIENPFARLKVFRRIATRYEKLHITFASMVTIACLFLWLTACALFQRHTLIPWSWFQAGGNPCALSLDPFALKLGINEIGPRWCECHWDTPPSVHTQGHEEGGSERERMNVVNYTYRA